MFTVKIDGAVVGTLPDDAKIIALNVLIGAFLFQEPCRGAITRNSFFEFFTTTGRPPNEFDIKYSITLPWQKEKPLTGIDNDLLIDHFSKNEFEFGKTISAVFNQTSKKTTFIIESDILQQRKTFIKQLKTILYGFHCNIPLKFAPLPIELIIYILIQARPYTVTPDDVNQLADIYLSNHKIMPPSPDSENVPSEFSTEKDVPRELKFFKQSQNSRSASCDQALNTFIVGAGIVCIAGYSGCTLF